MKRLVSMISWMKQRQWVLVVSVWMLGWAPAVLAAPGSWTATAPGFMVAMSERTADSASMTPPAGMTEPESRISGIQWRYRQPVGSQVKAWLCHPSRCVALTGMRGMTQALQGATAEAPLQFRFALPPGQRPVRVQGLQVIVNYQ
ncbi:flagellar protein FlhE [Halomonas sp. Bachu 37]|uniref:flagellar protein FlhE n=1 Tax=Halomonas kashgarensis TaxID=3084920 RepID=UPI0032163A92